MVENYCYVLFTAGKDFSSNLDGWKINVLICQNPTGSLKNHPCN